MSEVLTTTEIYAKYPSEWILIDDPVTDDKLHVQSGRVVFHSHDRDEVYRKAIELRPKRSAFLYTGKMQKGTAIIL